MALRRSSAQERTATWFQAGQSAGPTLLEYHGLQRLQAWFDQFKWAVFFWLLGGFANGYARHGFVQRWLRTGSRNTFAFANWSRGGSCLAGERYHVSAGGRKEGEVLSLRCGSERVAGNWSTEASRGLRRASRNRAWNSRKACVWWDLWRPTFEATFERRLRKRKNASARNRAITNHHLFNMIYSSIVYICFREMPSRVSNLEAYAERLRKQSRIDMYDTNAFADLRGHIVDFPRHTQSIIKKTQLKSGVLHCRPTIGNVITSGFHILLFLLTMENWAC